LESAVKSRRCVVGESPIQRMFPRAATELHWRKPAWGIRGTHTWEFGLRAWLSLAEEALLPQLPWNLSTWPEELLAQLVELILNPTLKEE